MNKMEKKEIALLAGILAFVLAIVFILLFAPHGSSDSSDDDVFPFWLIPIWFIVIVPALQKDKQVSEHDSKKALKILIAALAIGIFFLILLAFA
jgi:4-hydroxybenzoate polyprenyltransferase